MSTQYHPHKCKSCKGRIVIEEPEDDEYECIPTLCYSCEQDAVEKYEEKRRNRIAIENEY